MKISTTWSLICQKTKMTCETITRLKVQKREIKEKLQIWDLFWLWKEAKRLKIENEAGGQKRMKGTFVIKVRVVDKGSWASQKKNLLDVQGHKRQINSNQRGTIDFLRGVNSILNFIWVSFFSLFEMQIIN